MKSLIFICRLSIIVLFFGLSSCAPEKVVEDYTVPTISFQSADRSSIPLSKINIINAKDKLTIFLSSKPDTLFDVHASTSCDNTTNPELKSTRKTVLKQVNSVPVTSLFPWQAFAPEVKRGAIYCKINMTIKENHKTHLAEVIDIKLNNIDEAATIQLNTLDSDQNEVFLNDLAQTKVTLTLENFLGLTCDNGLRKYYRITSVEEVIGDFFNLDLFHKTVRCRLVEFNPESNYLSYSKSFVVRVNRHQPIYKWVWNKQFDINKKKSQLATLVVDNPSDQTLYLKRTELDRSFGPINLTTFFQNTVNHYLVMKPDEVRLRIWPDYNSTLFTNNIVEVPAGRTLKLPFYANVNAHCKDKTVTRRYQEKFLFWGVGVTWPRTPIAKFYTKNYDNSELSLVKTFFIHNSLNKLAYDQEVWFSEEKPSNYKSPHPHLSWDFKKGPTPPPHRGDAVFFYDRLRCIK